MELTGKSVLLSAWRATLVLLAGAMLTGCAYLKELVGLEPVKPRVQLLALEVSKASLSRIDLKCTLRVDNPNDFALTFANLKYALSVAGMALAAGEHLPELKIPGEGHAVFPLKIAIDAGNALKLTRKLLQSKGEEAALLQASFDFITPLGPMQVRLEELRPLAKIAGF